LGLLEGVVVDALRILEAAVDHGHAGLRDLGEPPQGGGGIAGDGQHRLGHLSEAGDIAGGEERTRPVVAAQHPLGGVIGGVRQPGRLLTPSDQAFDPVGGEGGIAGAVEHPGQQTTVTQAPSDALGFVGQRHAPLVVAGEAELGRQVGQQPRPLRGRLGADRCQGGFGDGDAVGVDVPDHAGQSARVGQRRPDQQGNIAGGLGEPAGFEQGGPELRASLVTLDLTKAAQRCNAF
jgi:hypothetical protein